LRVGLLKLPGGGFQRFGQSLLFRLADAGQLPAELLKGLGGLCRVSPFQGLAQFGGLFAHGVGCLAVRLPLLRAERGRPRGHVFHLPGQIGERGDGFLPRHLLLGELLGGALDGFQQRLARFLVDGGVLRDLLAQGLKLLRLLADGGLHQLLLRQNLALRVGQEQQEGQEGDHAEQDAEVAAPEAQGQVGSRVDAPGAGQGVFQQAGGDLRVGGAGAPGGDLQRRAQALLEIEGVVKEAGLAQAVLLAQPDHGQHCQCAQPGGDGAQHRDLLRQEDGAQAGGHRQHDAQADAGQQAARQPEQALLQPQTAIPASQQGQQLEGDFADHSHYPRSWHTSMMMQQAVSRYPALIVSDSLL